MLIEDVHHMTYNIATHIMKCVRFVNKASALYILGDFDGYNKGEYIGLG